MLQWVFYFFIYISIQWNEKYLVDIWHYGLKTRKCIGIQHISYDNPEELIWDTNFCIGK